MDKGLEQLTAMVFKMGEAAEKALNVSIGGFVRGKDTSEDVHELSEILVSMTVEVEEKAFGLIAKYQPVASDLRIINSHMKNRLRLRKIWKVCMGYFFYMQTSGWA